MITTPYAERNALADQIRNYTRVGFNEALTSADAMIASMLAETTADPLEAPPGWVHQLHHWIMHTFLVSPGIAAAAAQLAGAYFTTARYVSDNPIDRGWYAYNSSIFGTDLNEITIVAWYRVIGLTAQKIFQGGNVDIITGVVTPQDNTSWVSAGAEIATDNIINCYLTNSVGTAVLDARIDYGAHGKAQLDWFPILMSWSNIESKSSLWVGNVEANSYVAQSYATQLRMTTASNEIGDGRFGNQGNGTISDFWMTDEFIDFSVQANRDKFFDADIRPVSLGADGSLPTGTAPEIYFQGGYALDNLGTGVDWIVFGAPPPIAATSPTDL